MPAYPPEYTEEMNKNFYESLARPVEERTNLNVGKARSEALARGMEGDPFESLGVASARNQGAQQLGDLWSGISMQGADRAREERMTNLNREDTQAYGAEQAGLGRTWQSGESKLGRDWQSGESQKGRDWQSGENAVGRNFQEKMTQTNYDNAVGLQNRANRQGYQSELWGSAAKLAGGFLGGLF